MSDRSTAKNESRGTDAIVHDASSANLNPDGIADVGTLRLGAG